MMHPESKLQFRSIINRPSAKVFGWHLRPRMLERVIPPWEKISILHSEGRPNRIGSNLVIKSRFLVLFTTTIELEYAEYEQDERFLVRALSGILKDYAYETMVNSQGLNPENAYASEVIDRFKFSLKVPFFIKAYLLSSIKKRIARILKYKHDMIERDIDMINKYPFEKPLKILISGSHGLIGKNLGYFLEFMGHDVWHLCRGMGDNEKTVYWNPKTRECDPRNFEGFDTVIHLAGENVGKGRWTEKKK
ncbi:MAG: hypothetical protein KDK63_01775, partial [Chlamydiia bacterium]|nr:hypothetical protein [Chlamydiia bacterium]